MTDAVEAVPFPRPLGVPPAIAGSGGDTAEGSLLRARALVLHDLSIDGIDTADIVTALDEIVSGRTWWVRSWPQGAAFVAGQVAQDMVDRLLDTHGRWPTCRVHAGVPLDLEPELGEDPGWVCPRGCGAIAALGALPPDPLRPG